MKFQEKAIVDDIRSGRQYERLEGHLFLNFSVKNGNKDVPIRDYFVFINALHLPRRFFGIQFLCG